MNNLLSLSNLLITFTCFLIVAAPAEAAIIVERFGPDGTSAPHTIEQFNTVIGPLTSVEPDYRALTSSNTDYKFVRHIFSVEDDICFYWFRADEDPTSISLTEQWSNVYWYVGDVSENPCTFVDGAQDGSNNYVLLYNTADNLLVGVLQYDLNGWNDLNYPARLMAYAIDPNGLTYADAVAAIQAIPEPSTVALVSLALIGGLLRLRRRG